MLVILRADPKIEFIDQCNITFCACHSCYDVDESGLINFREFIMGIYVMSSGKLEERLEWTFRLFDCDQDGSVTKNEMLEIITVSNAILLLTKRE